MRKLLVISFALAALLFNPTVAFGHAGVVSLSPAQDEVLMSMTSEISIQFSEELLTISNQDVNTLTLNELDGPQINLENIRVEGEYIKASVPTDDYTPGTYQVIYKIVSADGHKVTNSFTFALNAPAVAASPVPADQGDGVVPSPIVAAIAIILIAGGFILFRARKP